MPERAFQGRIHHIDLVFNSDFLSCSEAVGTHLILPRDCVLASRLISSREYRIQRVADILGVSENDDRKELYAADKEQRRFFHMAFGKKDAPPDEFHLIINSDFLHQPEWAADIIHQAYNRKFQTENRTVA